MADLFFDFPSCQAQNRQIAVGRAHRQGRCTGWNKTSMLKDLLMMNNRFCLLKGLKQKVVIFSIL